jgi:hypothetical protein
VEVKVEVKEEERRDYIINMIDSTLDLAVERFSPVCGMGEGVLPTVSSQESIGRHLII